MKRIRLLYVMSLVLLAVPSCRYRGARISHEAEPVKVSVMSVSESRTQGTSAFIGSLEPVRKTTLSARHSGTLVELKVRKGDKVTKGQVVAVIGSQSVQSAWEMAHATLEQAEDGYRRASKVYESGGVADVKMVEISTQLSKARAAAAAADKAMEDCSIKAPFDGLVSDVFSDEGVELDFFAPIARIVDISELEVRISVPESEIGGLEIGRHARLEVAGMDDLGCTLGSKGVVASALSHSFDCTMKLDSQPSRLMPGMVCKVYLDRQGDKGIIVPASILQTGSDGRYLWIVRDAKVFRQPVGVGAFSGKGVTVTSGLEEGDLVIVKGYQKVSGGMRVDVHLVGAEEVF